MKKVVLVILISLFVFNIRNALAYEVPINCVVSKKVGNNVSSSILRGELLIDSGGNDSATLKLENKKVIANISLEHFSTNLSFSSVFSHFHMELAIKGTNYKTNVDEDSVVGYDTGFPQLSLTKGSTKYTVSCYTVSTASF